MKFSLIHITTHLPVKAFRGVYVTRLYPLACDGVNVPSISISIASQVTTYLMPKIPGFNRSLSVKRSLSAVKTRSVVSIDLSSVGKCRRLHLTCRQDLLHLSNWSPHRVDPVKWSLRNVDYTAT